MPQVVPVSDFRSNIKAVSEHTDAGEVVILTQNGRPRWAMIDYDEWNAAAREQERGFARAIATTEAKEARDGLATLSKEELDARLRERRSARGALAAS